MKTWLDFGAANTGLVLADITYYARKLEDGNAVDFTGASLSEPDATNLPGLYIFDAPQVLVRARGKAWITATPAIWTPLDLGTVLDDQVSDHAGVTGNVAEYLTWLSPILSLATQTFVGCEGWDGSQSGVLDVTFSNSLLNGNYFIIRAYGLQGSPTKDLGTLTAGGWTKDPTFTTVITGNYVLAVSAVVEDEAIPIGAGTLTITINNLLWGTAPVVRVFNLPTLKYDNAFFLHQDGYVSVLGAGLVSNTGGSAPALPDTSFTAE